jgi:hypothetical protein
MMYGVEFDYILTLFVVCDTYVRYIELQQRIYKISFHIAIKDGAISGFRGVVDQLSGLRSVYW